MLFYPAYYNPYAVLGYGLGYGGYGGYGGCGYGRRYGRRNRRY